MSDTHAAHAHGFRPDIQGLRALAVLLVLVFHAGLGLDGGYVGVDVFFVLSGFLITRLLVREGEKTGRINFLSFYARRSRRLLPAAVLVLVATTIATALWCPRSELSEFGLDAAFAAAYAVNWRFAERAVDYLAEDVGRSPVLHYWSLSVEEQFYFAWPLLVALGLSVSRRFQFLRVSTLAAILSLVAASSFVYAAFVSSGAESFFVTTTRLWELSIGAYLALAERPMGGLSRKLGPAFSLLGVGMVVSAAAVYDAKTPWPSAFTLLPTVGTALALIGGQAAPASPISKILGARPFRLVGDVSYSLYLWHWPLLVVGQDWFGLKGPAWGACLCALSALPATLSYLFVEQPLRTAKSLSSQPAFAVSLCSTLSLLAVSSGLALAYEGASGQKASTIGAVELTARGRNLIVTPRKAGAPALGKSPKLSEHGIPQSKYDVIYPAPENARRDVPSAYERDCQTRRGSSHVNWCEFGDVKSRRRFVLVGDSLMIQYADALGAIGKARGWRVETATKSSCPFSKDPSKPDDCRAFNENILRAFRENPPEGIFTTQYGVATAETLRPYWSELVNLGLKVIVIGANPHPPANQSIYQCLLRNQSDYLPCAFPRAEGIELSALPAQKKAAAEVAGVHLIDLTDYFCPRDLCPPVIGNVLVLRQGAHITNSYAQSLAPIISEKLEELGL
ncbi:MAG: hypothetical protein B6A08_14200 [Sorangiineae bacterium NIC37A_2]|nr:MAG: hypothetical protein B6A08_14200 [Sorangiineae bacterium NIC37A_2]